MEAATGVEPVSRGFADLRLNHLATPPLESPRSVTVGELYPTLTPALNIRPVLRTDGAQGGPRCLASFLLSHVPSLKDSPGPRRTQVKKSQAVLGPLLMGCLLGLIPSEAKASGVELRIGAFLPKLDSVLFRDSITLYTVNKSDFAGGFGGAELTANVHPNLELGFSIEGYGRENNTVYRDYVRPNGQEIRQTLRFETIPLSALARFVPKGRYRTITPYLGGGFSANFWKYEEWGDFVDFQARGNPVYFDSFKSEGTAFGPMVNAGIRYRINTDIQITADYRHFWGKETMKGDFRPNQISVAGDAITVGVRLIF
jgi:opacity protein-like surface antigen